MQPVVKQRVSDTLLTKLLEQSLDNYDPKCMSYFSRLDQHISRNFRDENIQTRPARSNGLWCCVLVPTILLGYSLQYEVTTPYRLVTFLSLGLLCYSCLFILFVSMTCLVLKKTKFGGCIASSLVSAMLIYLFLGESLKMTLAYSMCAVYMYAYLLQKSLTSYPYTFTLGEAMILQQGVVLFTANAATKFTHDYDPSDETKIVDVFVFTVLSTVGLIVTALVLLRQYDPGLKHLMGIVFFGAVYALAVIHVLLGRLALAIILVYVFRDVLRMQIVGLWLALVLMSVVTLVMRTRLAVKATTVTRKTFHVLASLVFMSGILYDVTFMKMAAGFGLAFLVFVEALRKSKIEPISSALQEAFYVYSDEKDVGEFAVTPLYLYCGLAAPLALCPAQAPRLELLAGVLAAGVGDSAASWVGAYYGRAYWPGSTKTLEGTAFNIVSQVATVYALDLFELLDSRNALARTCVAATAASLVEARTAQVDNLVLPLVMLIGFQTTTFLS